MAYKCCSLYNGICGAKRVQKKENMMLTEKTSEQTYKNLKPEKWKQLIQREAQEFLNHFEPTIAL